MDTFVKVATTGDLDEEDMMAVEVEGTKILLVRLQGQYYAISNVCSHADAWLDQGELRPDTWEVRCPLHQACFDLRTGEATEAPAYQPVPVYPIRIDGEDILVGPPA